ncbi:hypothetical protein T440DRAFT_461377 [Plenodomus tracheiphilus IPT5]|uniref:Uncharacterized protein n=1 Tax=Plenodomus tracheiphilus IPT5 TaxID=1408161 RepID=A0A6A7AP24_9PLEO|nr:hypothetical protein T440DRAFT_461377 [Plenodomus tracheiphilus IPT5]
MMPTEGTYYHYAASSMDQVVREFLENTTLRFGEPSSQVNAIKQALCDFSTMKISKKNAISAILVALENEEGLRRSLLSVLYHRDARWGVGDFEDLGQTLTQAVPQFLQPDHQPQLRLPPISPSWNTNHPPAQTIDPAMLSEYSGPHVFGQGNRQDCHYTWPSFSQSQSSPTSQGSPHLPSSSRLSLPALHFASTTGPTVSQYSRSTDEVLKDKFGIATQAMEMPHMRSDFHKTATEPTIVAYDAHLEYDENHGLMEEPASNDYHYRVLQPAREPERPYTVAPKVPLDIPPRHETVVGISTSHPMVVMPPPSKKHGQRASSIIASLIDRGAAIHKSIHSPVRAQMLLSRRIETTAPRSRAEGSCPFVHSLCGKAFSSRYGVKKHHWGAKNEDVNTTTGCWAKHRKPNVTWDAHPTCREQAVVSDATKRVGSKAVKQETKHTLLPALVGPSSYAVIPGFPTLQDLPQAVAEAVTPSLANRARSEDLGSCVGNRRCAPGGSGDGTRGVAVISTTEAPTLQGRDCEGPSAQVATAMRHGHTFLWMTDTKEHHGDSSMVGGGTDVDVMATSYPSPVSLPYAVMSRRDGSGYGTPFSSE